MNINAVMCFSCHQILNNSIISTSCWMDDNCIVCAHFLKHKEEYLSAQSNYFLTRVEECPWERDLHYQGCFEQKKWMDVVCHESQAQVQEA